MKRSRETNHIKLGFMKARPWVIARNLEGWDRASADFRHREQQELRWGVWGVQLEQGVATSRHSTEHIKLWMTKLSKRSRLSSDTEGHQHFNSSRLTMKTAVLLVPQQDLAMGSAQTREEGGEVPSNRRDPASLLCLPPLPWSRFIFSTFFLWFYFQALRFLMSQVLYF